MDARLRKRGLIQCPRTPLFMNHIKEIISSTASATRITVMVRICFCWADGFCFLRTRSTYC